MAEIDLSLYGLFFGRGKPEQINTADLPARKETGDYGSPYYAKDYLGREYYLPVRVTYTDPSKAGVIDSGIASGITGSAGQSITTGIPAATTTAGDTHTIDLPHPVVSISCEKHVVETPMTERVGSVIEISGIKGYRIRISGLMINRRELPEALMKQMRDVFRASNSINIRNVLTDLYLNEIGCMAVVKSFNLPEVRGVKGVWAYEIELVSDSIFNLYEI